MPATDNLAQLLKLSASRIRELESELTDAHKLARAMSIMEPLSQKGLATNIEGKTLYEKALSLTKMADVDFAMWEHLAQNGPGVYNGFGKVAVNKVMGNSDDPASRVDRIVLSSHL